MSISPINTADFIVIGAGIAGTSAAATLARHGSVILLEMESQPGYHATGRSAAFFAAAYGGGTIRGLTGLCEPFFLSPPEGFSEAPLIRLRDCMFFGRADQQATLQQMQEDNTRLIALNGDEVNRRVPILSPETIDGAMWDKMGGDLDVDAILQGFLRQLKRRQGRFLNQTRVDSLVRNNGVWEVGAGGEVLKAPVVVNAAGAWADPVAVLAGLAPLGITPLRRTALTIDPPDGIDITDWPLMIEADELFYFKPDAGQLLISPADETPSPPCDAQAEDIDVAIGVDRFEKATGIEIHRVNHSWAGLRTFAPDHCFVAGYDPRTEGFFWLAGQGGYGVQSAPGMAQLATSMATGSAPETGFEGVMDYVDDVKPERLLQ
jgi:D-arginine dehydrogenase